MFFIYVFIKLLSLQQKLLFFVYIFPLSAQDQDFQLNSQYLQNMFNTKKEIQLSR